MIDEGDDVLEGVFHEGLFSIGDDFTFLEVGESHEWWSRWYESDSMLSSMIECFEDIEILYFYRVCILLGAKCIFYIDDILILGKIIVKKSPSSKDNTIFSTIAIDPSSDSSCRSEIRRQECYIFISIYLSFLCEEREEYIIREDESRPRFYICVYIFLLKYRVYIVVYFCCIPLNLFAWIFS